MSQTYPEFAHVHHDDPEEQRNLFSALPREFQIIQESRVPLLQVPETDKDRELDPSSFQDFIIIAEFSELEGPIPLATIPESVDVPLCLNNFSVHLMSTDYQVNSVGHFKISEDTQVMRKNVFKNVHVFMQYFTLYDIKARGFVRPFCFGYVSKDHVKLDHKLEFMVHEFDRMTKVLKQANRTWFGRELEQYLDKLRAAKDSFIQSRWKETGEDESSDGDMLSAASDENDPDAITLEQIANQYLEIENILKTVKSFERPDHLSELCKLSKFLHFHLSSYDHFITLLSKLEINFQPNALQKSIYHLNLPLVHPLKAKGESLRPLTTLGQVGTLHLIWKLVLLHREHHTDLIFSIMKSLTTDFQSHCRYVKEQRKKGKEEVKLNSSTSSNESASPEKKGEEQQDSDSRSGFNSKEEASLVSCFLQNADVSLILDKIHTTCPLPPASSCTPDNKSVSSYHTISEQEDSDVVDPAAVPPENIDMPSSTNDGVDTYPRASISSYSQSSEGSISSVTNISTITGISATTPTSNPSSPSPLPSSEETIMRTSWVDYAEGNLSRGSPGSGILKFFRHYPKVAHHILYSVLIGRPIVICGSEEQSSKVSRIITALIPFVPPSHKISTSHPSFSSSWKLLRFHRGVLVPSHIQTFRLIGLCIPERLTVHDLVHSRDQSAVTILNISQKKCVLLGPAYSGEFLSVFDTTTQIQRNFNNSDLSFLTFLGGILTEIQTKLYLLKSLQEKDKKDKKKRITTNYRELNLKGSDVEIVKHFASLISTPDQVLDFF